MGMVGGRGVKQAAGRSWKNEWALDEKLAGWGGEGGGEAGGRSSGSPKLPRLTHQSSSLHIRPSSTPSTPVPPTHPIFKAVRPPILILSPLQRLSISSWKLSCVGQRRGSVSISAQLSPFSVIPLSLLLLLLLKQLFGASALFSLSPRGFCWPRKSQPAGFTLSSSFFLAQSTFTHWSILPAAVPLFYFLLPAIAGRIKETDGRMGFDERAALHSLSHEMERGFLVLFWIS